MRTKISGLSYPFMPFLAVADLAVLYFLGLCLAKWAWEGYFLMAQTLTVSTMPLMLIVLIYSGVYQSWRLKGAYYFFQRIFIAVWLSFFLVLLAVVLFDFMAAVSVGWLVVYFAITNAGMFGYRLAVGLVMNWMRIHGFNNRSVVLIGDSGQTQDIHAYFLKHKKFGINIVHTVEVDQVSEVGEDDSLLELNCREIQACFRPDDIWLCLPPSKADKINALKSRLRDSLANIRYISQTSDLLLIKSHNGMEMVFNSVDLNDSQLSGLHYYLKLSIDFLLAALILLLISPIMLGIAIAIKMTSKGPVFFKQARLGIAGRPITIYKFRSMAVHIETLGQVTQATKNDARITKFGAFLRRSSLDELPQFINVLQGRMSIVGPRPHAVAHNDYYSRRVGRYMFRHRIKSGITGWAQVNGCRGETDTLEKMEARVRYDLWYIENGSFWLDVRIIIMTAFKGFVNPNAY